MRSTGVGSDRARTEGRAAPAAADEIIASGDDAYVYRGEFICRENATGGWVLEVPPFSHDTPFVSA
jgi:hypothetical protein